MTSPAPVHRRTEHDLRAALAKLEGLAPATDEVLSVLSGPLAPRAARRPRAGRRSRLRRAYLAGRVPWWSPRPWLTVGAAAAAAVAATAAVGLTMSLLPGSVSAPGGGLPDGRAPGGTAALPTPAPPTPALPSAAKVGRAMLTASATSRDVLYTTQTDRIGGVIQQMLRAWAWPLQPAAGQQAHWRQASRVRAGRGGPLELDEDTGLAYTAPPVGVAGAAGQLTVVCYASASDSTCGNGAAKTPGGGSWSVQYGRFSNPGPGPGGLSLATLGHDIVTGLWQVSGRTQANGKQVIVLSEAMAGSYQPMPAQLWVDAGTFLPQQIRWGTGRDVTQVAWHYLPPTPAARALLQVPVPYREAGPGSE